jgi:hypothetical protein
VGILVASPTPIYGNTISIIKYDRGRKRVFHANKVGIVIRQRPMARIWDQVLHSDIVVRCGESGNTRTPSLGIS